jgi:hypothetical protein
VSKPQLQHNAGLGMNGLDKRANVGWWRWVRIHAFIINCAELGMHPANSTTTSIAAVQLFMQTCPFTPVATFYGYNGTRYPCLLLFSTIDRFTMQVSVVEPDAGDLFFQESCVLAPAYICQAGSDDPSQAYTTVYATTITRTTTTTLTVMG